MKVITIANQKGGVGKTTTCQTFACGLVLKGYKVLAIDCDSQRNMTFTFNGMNHEGKNIFNVLLQEPIEEAIIKTNQKVDLIPSSDKLYIADSVFSQADDIYRLKLQLQKIADNYDYCIIDTPPTLNTITKNCFIASDSIIIPMLTDSFSMQGLSQLLATIEATKEAQRRKGIKEVKIEGILLTQYNDRTILNRMLTNQIEKISNQTGLNVFKTTIRKGVIVGEAQNNQSNVFALNPKANVSKDYDSFIKEYLKSYK
jgi:chromosome partitioning protein